MLPRALMRLRSAESPLLGAVGSLKTAASDSHRVVYGERSLVQLLSLGVASEGTLLTAATLGLLPASYHPLAAACAARRAPPGCPSLSLHVSENMLSPPLAEEKTLAASTSCAWVHVAGEGGGEHLRTVPIPAAPPLLPA